MVTAYQVLNGEVRHLTLKELAVALHSPDGMVWVDLENPLEAEEETLLVSIFDFHPLSIEDCQRGKDEDGHLPKVEDFGDYLFIIFNPVTTPEEDIRSPGDRFFTVSTTQLSAYLSERCLVTHHYRPLRSIAHARDLCLSNPRALARGPDFFFHIIIDHLVDNYTPVLERLDTEVDATEAEVFRNPTQETMVNILRMKKDITTLRRIGLYQRDMLNRLSRGEFSLITREEMVYYRNVYDHLVRMTDLAETYRESVAGLLDAYLSVTSNRLSQVMKVLTIISTIFLPLGVITGFFGMNFHNLPGIAWEYGVAATAIVMGGVAGIMLWVFRRKGWV